MNPIRALLEKCYYKDSKVVTIYFLGVIFEATVKLDLLEIFEIVRCE